MIRIYIAGPYTQGDVARNVWNAIEAATLLADAGFAPYIPHLSHFWHLLFPHPYEFWTTRDLQYLPCCQAVFRLPGASDGADQEVEVAHGLGIPVFHAVDGLLTHFRKGM